VADYQDAPWSCHIQVAPASVITTQDKATEEDAILRARTQIYDGLGNMGDLTVAQRITQAKNAFEPVLKLAGQSSRHCKTAYAFLVELENRLKMNNTNAPLVCVRMTAVDSALSQNANYMGINFANRKRKRSSNRKKNTEWDQKEV